MNMIEIERALRELRLSGIAETLSTRVMQAQASQEPFLDTFAAMLQDELDRRRSRLAVSAACWADSCAINWAANSVTAPLLNALRSSVLSAVTSSMCHHCLQP